MLARHTAKHSSGGSLKSVILLGAGYRAAGLDPSPLLESGVPVLTSWQGMDLVDNWHPNYFGRTGIYGQRAANRIFYEADVIYSVGTRLCAWQVGHAGIRPDQQIIRFNPGHHPEMKASSDWHSQCQIYRIQYPWVESPAHDDTNGYINSYRFIQRLEPLLREDEIIVTDNGSVMCPIFQALHVKPPQRVLTSGALGEMGCGLPNAIGASFARSKGQVLLFAGDGGMMMNLQELQTIRTHDLPIKIMVFANDGYSMIKGTYDNVKKPRVGVSESTGLGMPDFCRIANSFGIDSVDVRTWAEFDERVPWMLEHEDAFLMQVHIDPEQMFVPRLKPIMGADGKFTPARFDQLSPVLSDFKPLVEADLA